MIKVYALLPGNPDSIECLNKLFREGYRPIFRPTAQNVSTSSSQGISSEGGYIVYTLKKLT